VGTVSYIQDSEFESVLAQSELLVVDISTTWCGPCRKIARYMDKLDDAYKEQVKIVKIDLEQQKQTAHKFSVHRIPAVLIFKDKELVENFSGVKPYGTYAEAISHHL